MFENILFITLLDFTATNEYTKTEIKDASFLIKN